MTTCCPDFIFSKWKVFYDNKDRPGRYLLAKELIGRPDAEDLEVSWILDLVPIELWHIITHRI